MENCYNHPERKAHSICHNCGRSFCEDCLTVGTEFYYCKSPECQKKFNEDIESELSQEEIICPNCQSILHISKEELGSAGFRCMECESYIIILNGRPESLEDKNYIRLLSSVNQEDTAVIKSLLDDAGVDYYVTGENSFYGPVVLFVNEKQINLAKEILKDFKLYAYGSSVDDEEDID